MPEKSAFTKRALEALDAPQDGSRYVYDTKQPGLCLCITANGIKTFYRYGRINGRPERVKLGRFPELTVENARKASAAVTGDVAKGDNPQDKKRRARTVLTLGELFDFYLEHHAKPHKKSWKADQWQFDKFLAPWKNRKLSEIRKSDYQALHVRLGKEPGPHTANRLRSLLHAMFNLAIDVGTWDKANPIRGIKKYRELSRERFLQADELPRFFAALQADPNELARDFFTLALLTGARRGNVQAMRWEHVSLERATWEIPAGEMKAGDQMTVPLAPEAIEVLNRRKERSNGSSWVFPSKGKTGHLVEPRSAWDRILERAGLAGLRMHDLRRSLGSWMAATGASLPIVGKALGHKNASTTQIYARLNLDPVRASVDAAVAAMVLAGAKEGGGNG